MTSLFEKKFFDLLLYYKAPSQTSNLINTANLKQNSKIFYMYYQGLIWSCFVKKTEDDKFYDTVPLIMPVLPVAACVFSSSIPIG
jgi:hypothetical protein